MSKLTRKVKHITWLFKKSGNKVTVKNSLPVAQVMSSVRKPEPMKGVKNPEHLQQKLPHKLLPKILGGTK